MIHARTSDEDHLAIATRRESAVHLGYRLLHTREPVTGPPLEHASLLQLVAFPGRQPYLNGEPRKDVRGPVNHEFIDLFDWEGPST